MNLCSIQNSSYNNFTIENKQLLIPEKIFWKKKRMTGKKILTEKKKLQKNNYLSKCSKHQQRSLPSMAFLVVFPEILKLTLPWSGDPCLLCL
jgi:hypothetical protein